MIQNFQFGEWLPDAPDFKNPGLEVCLNATPKPDGYSPAYAITGTGSVVVGTVLGAIGFVRAGGVRGIAVATTNDIYTIIGGAVTASGLGFSASTDARFTFEQFNNTVYASSKSIGMFSLPNIQTDVTFVAGTGSPPSANAMGRVGDFLLLGDMIDINSSDAPFRVRWSQFNNPDGAWASDIATQSDAVDMQQEQGIVTNISGGDFGLIFQERGISRVTYSGGPSVFAKELFEPDRGCPAPESVVRVGQIAYFLSAEGFFATDGNSVQPISRSKIWKWFQENANPSFVNLTQGSVDAPNRCVVWTFAGGDDSTKTHQVYFNWESGRWSVVERGVDYLVRSGRSAVTLEQLAAIYPDLDAMTISLDSPLFKESNQSLMCLHGGELSELVGPSLKATFGSGSFQFGPGKRTFIRSVTPLVENDNFDTVVSVGSRDHMTTTPIMSPETPIGPIGFAGLASDGRYFRVNVSVPGGSQWKNAVGFQVDASVSGVT